jgi:hypothetical protein
MPQIVVRSQSIIDTIHNGQVELNGFCEGRCMLQFSAASVPTTKNTKHIKLGLCRGNEVNWVYDSEVGVASALEYGPRGAFHTLLTIVIPAIAQHCSATPAALQTELLSMRQMNRESSSHTSQWDVMLGHLALAQLAKTVRWVSNLQTHALPSNLVSYPNRLLMDFPEPAP